MDWDYNDRSELTDANRRTGTTPDTGSPTSSPHTWDFAYDAIGNRLTFDLDADGTLTVYDANDLNQYEDTTNPTEDFDYDEDGNLDVDGNYDYTWDCENRLILVAPASSPVNGDKKLEFGYDYMGRRVRKTAWTHNGSAWVQDSDVRFVYDDWNPVLVLDDSNDVIRKYTWGLDLSGQQGAAGFSPRGLANGTSAASGIHGAGGIGGLLASLEVNDPETTSDDEWYWFTYDANGNVGQVLEYDPSTQTTALAAHYEYDPYGNVIVASDVDSSGYVNDNPFRFSTKWHDTELPGHTLVYYGYRYYSPRLGRWLNRDPITELGGLNLYGFVLNRPVNSVDANGEAVWALIPLVIKVAAGTGAGWNFVMTCYCCYHWHDCHWRAVERARQAAQSWEELIDGLETTEQQVEALEIMKNTMMAAQYGAECGWLATCCGTRALNTVTWLLGRYFALKIYYSVS